MIFCTSSKDDAWKTKTKMEAKLCSGEFLATNAKEFIYSSLPCCVTVTCFLYLVVCGCCMKTDLRETDSGDV
jgi:hypothetical protein